ncbi:MAG: PGDYG domain-containing protein [bacterium]|nr:PGDYG domain-containing protein [bacterium]
MSETQLQFVERKAPEIMSALAEAPVYKKQGSVLARPATPGEEIKTTLESGAEETVNTANEGDWIVTNPSGEQYIISEAKFLGRYEATDEDGTYTAKGFCRAITNPFGQPIEIMASWGSPQTGDERCMIADTCNADGECDGEPYLIDADAFTETYKQV